MYQMKMLSHNWLPTNRPTNRPLTDQLLELLEWLFATNKTNWVLVVAVILISLVHLVIAKFLSLSLHLIT